jgi:hypothetical protein
MESRTESSNERIDRHWRRWVSFAGEWGLGSDPWLDTVPEDGERLLLGRSFVMYCRTYNFDREGRAHSERAKQMVSTSLRDAVSCVASSFRERGRPSPFHVPIGVHGGGSIHPRIRSLLAGFESKDPLPHRQKALTPALLTDIHKATRGESEDWQHTADLVRGAYFFAMRACEFCRTEKPGRTRRLKAENVTFREEDGSLISHDDPRLTERAQFVTVCFTDQKNGTRMEKRSQRRSGVHTLCPVEAWGSVIRRMVNHFPDTRTRNRTSVCSYKMEGKTMEITAAQVTTLLRKVCSNNGQQRYGISPNEIGTRSIRSGAAMALAVQGGQSDEKIRILGRWKSLAFLTYIRPQVLEWSGGMATEMAQANTFRDLGERTNQTKDKSPTKKRHPEPIHPIEHSFPKFQAFDKGKWQGNGQRESRVSHESGPGN